MSLFVYNIAIRCYAWAIFIASFWNRKAKLFWLGRSKQIVATEEQSTFWFHCASLGEYEQAKPLIIASKQSFPDVKMVVTFFSPSGYEVRKDISVADKVYYLPLDTKQNASAFIKTINPAKAFFIKYEFWHHYLHELKKANVPTYLVAGTFREQQIFFKWYGGLFRKMLHQFTCLFVQSENDSNLLRKVCEVPILVTGDTRFDTVWKTAEKAQRFPKVDAFVGNKPCLVIGSSWLSDEALIADLLSLLGRYQIIIAPHEVNEERVQQIEQLFDYTIRYSEYTGGKDQSVLIIDNIGMLSSLYAYADWVYIGGGFGVSIHNVLEAAVFDVPVVFGPNHKKMKEALELLTVGAAFSVRNKQELQKVIEQMEVEAFRLVSGKKGGDYVRSKLGATEKIMAEIMK